MLLSVALQTTQHKRTNDHPRLLPHKPPYSTQNRLTTGSYTCLGTLRTWGSEGWLGKEILEEGGLLSFGLE